MRFISNKSMLLAGCGLAIMAVPATAQDVPVDEDVIIVTGTAIRGVDRRGAAIRGSTSAM